MISFVSQVHRYNKSFRRQLLLPFRALSPLYTDADDKQNDTENQADNAEGPEARVDRDQGNERIDTNMLADDARLNKVLVDDQNISTAAKTEFV